MPKTRFLASVGGFWPVLGAAWGEPTTRGLQNPQNPKFKNLSGFESFDQKKFRLLKHPKRLGLGQKVPGKHPFGPNEPRFLGPIDFGVQGPGAQGNIGEYWWRLRGEFVLSWVRGRDKSSFLLLK